MGLRFKGLGLDDVKADKILCGNFVRRVSETPREINRSALVRYIEKYRHLIQDEITKQMIDYELEGLRKEK